LLKALRAIMFRAVKLRQSGPPVAILEQEIALQEGLSHKLYYNRLTTLTRDLTQG